MLSADSLISGHHVFTSEGELPPVTLELREDLSLITGLWTTLHTITSISSLVPKSLKFAKPKKLPAALEMVKRIISAILT